MKTKKERKEELTLLIVAHQINGMDCSEVVQTMIDEFGCFWFPTLKEEE